MKKSLLILFILSIILVGCGDSSTSDNNVEINNDIQETEDKQEEQKREEKLNEVADFIKQKEYDKAISLAADYRGEADFDTLRIYAFALENKDNGNLEKYEKYISQIPNTYDGLLADQINKVKPDSSVDEELSKDEITTQMVQHIKDGELEEYRKLKEEYNIEFESPYDGYNKIPQIGMTTEEILESSWGKPIDINRTTTEYSVSEQWVYDGYKYIYFEDGIVTAIQE